MKPATVLFAIAALLAGCESSGQELDVDSARSGFHHHRSLQFRSDNPDLQFELLQLAEAAGQEREFGYVSTRGGRWIQMNEVVSVEYKLEPALDELAEYLAHRDIELPAREARQMISAIEIFKPCSVLAGLDNSLVLNDPNFNDKYRKYIETWREFNADIRNTIRSEQAQSFKDDVMDFLLRIYFTNYDSLWGLPRRGAQPMGNERTRFVD